MPDHLILASATLILALGTFTLRLAGPVLRARIALPSWAEHLLETSAIVLLAALAATAALTSGHHFAGPAAPVGVLAGGLLAWRKASFLTVILTAASTTALLHLVHIP